MQEKDKNYNEIILCLLWMILKTFNILKIIHMEKMGFNKACLHFYTDFFQILINMRNSAIKTT